MERARSYYTVDIIAPWRDYFNHRLIERLQLMVGVENMTGITGPHFGRERLGRAATPRRRSRQNVSIKAQAQRDAERIPITIHDISVVGAVFSTLRMFSIGQKITLIVGQDIRILAIVIWNKDGRIGCQFTKPISSYIFDQFE